MSRVIGFKLIESIDNYQVEVLITIAIVIVIEGSTIAHFLQTSGPLAIVGAGILAGNHIEQNEMSDIPADYLDKFWELIYEVMNAILFVLVGLELLIIDDLTILIFIALILVFILLLARFLSVWIPSLLVRFKEKLNIMTFIILTWGGLRGGIYIALALSIKEEYGRDIWVTITYIIVCFSILVQGLTLEKLVKKSSSSNVIITTAQ